MLEALIITLREGVEAALIIAIVITYLRRVGRGELVGSAYLGLGAALVASLAGAVAFNSLQINEEQFEGWTMLVASAFITSMVIWMWRTSKTLKGEIEAKVDHIASRRSGRFSPALFLFVFVMVVREGVETVLLLGAVQFNTESVANFAGALIGILLAVAFGVLFIKGAIRVNLRKFFSITSIILILVAVQLFISALHELSEAMVLPSSAREMAIIGPIVKNQVFFYVIVIALTIFLIMFRRPKPVIEVPDGNPAEKRKALYQARRERLWTLSGAALGMVVIIGLSAQYIYSINAGELSPPEIIFSQGEEVRIPVSRVEDGNLHRFAYRVDDQLVRFIIIKLKSGDMGVALDACAICGGAGYFQVGQDVICKNCTAAINPVSIGDSGGCNPIPVRAQTENSEIIVSAEDLEAGVSFFLPTGHQH
jgi:FTR1 family protein